MNQNISYVLGFAFDLRHVLLIHKLRPEWQAGLLNGIGGKIQDGDQTPYHAMVREFKEESGVETTPEQWHRFAKMEFRNGIIVHCFASNTIDIHAAKSMTDEWIMIVDEMRASLENSKVVKNLTWLIPMARYSLKYEKLDGHVACDCVADWNRLRDIAAEDWLRDQLADRVKELEKTREALRKLYIAIKEDNFVTDLELNEAKDVLAK